MQKSQIEKMVSLALVIAILAVGVALFTYIQVATGAGGFIGPGSAPPPAGTATGVLSYDGTVLNVNSHIITGVSAPFDLSDAVNLDTLNNRLLAAAGGGGLYEVNCGWETPPSQGADGVFPNILPARGSCSPGTGAGPGNECFGTDTIVATTACWYTSHDYEFIQNSNRYDWMGGTGVCRAVCQR